MADREQEKPASPAVPSLERERERAVELLSFHFAQDNLSLEELERRMERVYAARSLPALRELTQDLPSDVDAAPAARAVPVPAAFAPQRERIVAIMSETRRGGLAQLPRELDVRVLMADLKLDLTGTPIPSGVTDVRVRALMATVEVRVPRGVRVVVQPSAIMASVNDHELLYDDVRPDAPVIRITGRVIMTELKIVTGTTVRRLPSR
jgi:Domain of unknown function (DUF1707)/Cell wall-active antibiotics response 4TMS YvqF